MSVGIYNAKQNNPLKLLISTKKTNQTTHTAIILSALVIHTVYMCVCVCDDCIHVFVTFVKQLLVKLAADVSNESAELDF